jgi:twitching motility protein PilT
VDAVEALLSEMNELRASDLFLAEGRALSLRVDGEVRLTLHPPLAREDLDAFLGRVLRAAQREHFEKSGDLDAGFTHPTLGRFRLHLHAQRGLLGAVVRAVPSGHLAFENLRLPAVLQELAERPRGLVLVVGPTGSGKSTTLASMVHHLNATQARHIVTLEDPIEHVHEDLVGMITQREVFGDTRDWASGLRAAVRQSPDVILVGEMRDAESMTVALSAALTGHLVLSSLHTLDATQTLQRILSYYPEHVRQQVCTDLSLCLEGIVAQRLVPRRDEAGRVAACEVTLATPAVRRLLREQRIDEIADAAQGVAGCQTFNASLLELHREGIISTEAATAYAPNPDDFRLALQGLTRGAVVHDDEAAADAIPGGVDMKQLLHLALARGASDLHLVATRPPLLRVDGELMPVEGAEPLTAATVRRLVFSVLSQAQRERFDLERELDLGLTVTGGHRFRVNAHMQRGTVAVSVRLIPTTIPSPDALRVPQVLRDLAMRHQGLVLVTGPTGAGKSTTLASLVNLVNERRNCHVITIEDPIEFVHENRAATVEQREVAADTASFAAALKYILRQDPDVILVGEMRDPDTISAALTAAETGHLVFSTLHANDAPATIDRIVDAFPPHQQAQVRTQLSLALLAVVAQRLVVRADGRGRVAAFEVMVATPAVRNLIRENKLHQLPSTIETGASAGMVTLDRSLAELVRGGAVQLDEALRYARNASSVKAYLQGAAPTHVTPPTTE